MQRVDTSKLNPKQKMQYKAVHCRMVCAPTCSWLVSLMFLAFLSLLDASVSAGCLFYGSLLDVSVPAGCLWSCLCLLDASACLFHGSLRRQTLWRKLNGSPSAGGDYEGAPRERM